MATHSVQDMAAESGTVYVAEMPNGFGTIGICIRKGIVTRVFFDGSPTSGEFPEDVKAIFHQFQDYFNGKIKSFDIEIDVPSGFLGEVMEWLMRIPYGKTVSYSGLANSMGRPGAARAVGNACARNPLPILVPCHRVVKSDGSIGGFQAGRRMKERLLAMENTVAGC